MVSACKSSQSYVMGNSRIGDWRLIKKSSYVFSMLGENGMSEDWSNQNRFQEADELMLGLIRVWRTEMEEGGKSMSEKGEGTEAQRWAWTMLSPRPVLFLPFPPLQLNWMLRTGKKKITTVGASLLVQWLRLCTSNAGGPRFDPWSEN